MINSEALESVDNSPRRLNAVEGLIARGASILASFVLTVLAARLLGARDSGVFFIVLTTVAVLATVARFGTDNLALKLSGAPGSALGQNVPRLLAVCGIAGLVTLVVAGASVMAAGQLLHGVETPVLVGLIAIVPQALSGVAGSMLRGCGRLAAGTLAELGSIPALALSLLTLESFAAHATLIAAVFALVAGAWLTAFWAIPTALVASRSQMVSGARPAPGRQFVRRHWRQLTSMMGTSLLFYALTWAPLFVLAITSGSAAVAYYTVAARLAAVISLVPAIQISYLAPAFARLYHRGQIAALNDLCNRSTWQAMLVATFPALLLIVAAHAVVVSIYGSAFGVATTPLILLSIAALIAVAGGQVNQLMLLCDLEGSALALNLIWLIAWITAGVLIVARGGVVAACAFALATTVIYAVLAIVVLARSRAIYSFMRMPAL